MSYITDIQEKRNLTINDIIEVSTNYIPVQYRSCAYSYKDSQGRSLEHGTAILETEELCCAYMVAYGRMHRAKLYKTFEEDSRFPYEYLNQGFEVFDWGCGQGIGTMALIENLRNRGMLRQLKKITLEEPSDIARSRAILHIQQALKGRDVEIKAISDFLPSDFKSAHHTITSIDVEQPCVIHIFSNILDLYTVSLKKVSQLICSSGKRHIVLCVGPSRLKEERYNSFIRYFNSDTTNVFFQYRNTNFGAHPNGHPYGCFLKNFTYTLDATKSSLQRYKFYAPIQLFASYAEDITKKDSEDAAFEILSLYDMTAHSEIEPLYALISNLISRGMPTLASDKVIRFVSNLDSKNRRKALLTIARIQKTLVEALITKRLSTNKRLWNIIIIEDHTNVSQIALEDFSDIFNNLARMTVKYEKQSLPTIKLYNKDTAKYDLEYDIIIDISVDKFCNPENVEFPKYKVYNDCSFIVRSSKSIYEKRRLYTTERIMYKPLVEKDRQGNYIEIKEQTQRLRYFLHLIFRKEDFRPGQLPILNRALQLKSVIGLLPTGGGKSLTYQLAAMLQPAITLVIDPLKGLMKDQYDGLLRTGIDCISYINSDLNKKEKKDREDLLTEAQVQIMFLSPERLSIYNFRRVLRSMRESEIYFAYGVIDEVHCVSEWGHDFRLAYLHLGRNLYNYVLPKKVADMESHISLFGLTATASFDVLADVERELSGKDSYSLESDATIRYENTNRLELQYNVYPVVGEAQSSWEIGDLKESNITDAINDSTYKLQEIQSEKSINEIKSRFIERENMTDIKKKKDIQDTNLYINIENNWYTKQDTETAGIIFCLRKSGNTNLSVPSVSNKLYLKGLKYLSTYKGGDDTTNQEAFLLGRTNTMVATKAFGMGIDKPNVRITVHTNYPSSLESFVQEAGRAGRDKRMAIATIMYSPLKFAVRDVKTQTWAQMSADYANNKFFYDSNFLGEEFELFVMSLMMEGLSVQISNEEFRDIENPTKAWIHGIIQFIKRYKVGSILTYYINYEASEEVLDNYNSILQEHEMPLFETRYARTIKTERGYSYTKEYGSANYKDAIQKAIYRMCIIGLIEDFTEDYSSHTFRITTKCQEDYVYYQNLHNYYRKYYSEERTTAMIEEVKQNAFIEGTIMACLRHLTAFIYRSIAEKRARSILDMEHFCNMAISSNKDWKVTNEELKDYIYFYFNSKYAREGFVTYDSSIRKDIPFSLKDDTNHDIHSENEISSFDLVKKYMRVIDKEIVNNDSQKDNVKHLQGAIRLIRRAIAETNPALNLLNIFCIMFLGQEENEMLEEEIYNDYKGVVLYYTQKGELSILDKFTKMLMERSILKKGEEDYFKKLQYAVLLKGHVENVRRIINKYTQI